MIEPAPAEMHFATATADDRCLACHFTIEGLARALVGNVALICIPHMRDLSRSIDADDSDLLRLPTRGRGG